MLRTRALVRPAATAVEGPRADAGGRSWGTIDPKGGKVLLDRESYVVLDIRSAREFDESHITKPASMIKYLNKTIYYICHNFKAP